MRVTAAELAVLQKASGDGKPITLTCAYCCQTSIVQHPRNTRVPKDERWWVNTFIAGGTAKEPWPIVCPTCWPSIETLQALAS